MTAFHVIRVALQSDNHYQVWLDSTEVLTGTTSSGTQSGILFGTSGSVTKTVDSYWNYVSYSMEYIPIE